MNFREFVQGSIDLAKNNVKSLLSKFSQDIPQNERPIEGDKNIAGWIGDLCNEAIKYYETTFSKSTNYRFNKSKDIKTFYENILRVESGNIWDIIGHRNLGENSWKSEIVDTEIQRQIRFKTSYNTAEVHEVVVTPNIHGLTDIINQEQVTTNWNEEWNYRVKLAETFGHVDILSILDKGVNPDGVADEITCEPGSVFYSPHAKSILKKDGCWYAVYITNANADWVRANTRLNPSDLSTVKNSNIDKLSLTSKSSEEYTNTPTYPVIHCYLDDNTLEYIPVEEWGFDPQETQLEYGTILNGGQIDVDPNDNHIYHMEGHSGQLQAIHDKVQEDETNGVLTPENLASAQNLATILDTHNQTHQQHMDDPGIQKRKQRMKYPFGRYILKVGDEIALDIPNPYIMDWRMLFHRLYNERVPGRLDGRGLPEILYQDEKAMAIILSRNADLALMQVPQPWLREEEKKVEAIDGVKGNDPTKRHYYKITPPIFPNVGSMPADNWAYHIHKQNSRDQLGVDKVAMGESTGSHSSAKKEQFLASQNAAIIQGELNQNLNDVIRDVIQTRIEMYKRFYVRPRYWNVDGKFELISLSRMLTYMMVKDEQGNPQEVQIPKFEVYVRPQSNFPFKWENDLSLLMQAYSMMKPDGTPLISAEVLLNKLEEKFPSIAEHRQLDQATAIGLQVMRKEQEQKEADRKLDTKTINKFESKALSLLTKGDAITQQ